MKTSRSEVANLKHLKNYEAFILDMKVTETGKTTYKVGPLFIVIFIMRAIEN